MIDTIDIALYYAHEHAGTWSLCALAQHRGVIHPDDLDPDAFYNAVGAIRMYHDRFHCFLETGESGDLTSYVYFLMESLVALASVPVPPQLEHLSPPRIIPGFDRILAALHQEDESRIVLEHNDDNIAISFVDHRGNASDERLSPYFRGLIVTKEQWRRSALQALQEFVRVAEERIQDGSSPRLQNLLEQWHLLSKL